MKNTLLSLLTIILIAGCRSSPSQKIDVLKDLITKQLGKEVIIQKNKPETFALGFSEKDKSTSYLIVRLSDMKIVEQERISQGNIAWNGEMELKITKIPGIIRATDQPSDFVTIVNLNKYLIKQF